MNKENTVNSTPMQVSPETDATQNTALAAQEGCVKLMIGGALQDVCPNPNPNPSDE